MLKMCRRYLSSGCASVSAGQGEGGKMYKTTIDTARGTCHRSAGFKLGSFRSIGL